MSEPAMAPIARIGNAQPKGNDVKIGYDRRDDTGRHEPRPNDVFPEAKANGKRNGRMCEYRGHRVRKERSNRSANELRTSVADCSGSRTIGRPPRCRTVLSRSQLRSLIYKKEKGPDCVGRAPEVNDVTSLRSPPVPG